MEPLISPVLRSFEQAREDLALHMADLTAEQIWLSPHGFGSVGFHVRHIARSVERLSTYLQGRQLSTAQLAALQTEGAPGAARDELLSELEAFLNRAEQVVRTIDPATFAEAREVGRKRLPTTVIGLLVHMAEHTQRHVGQAIIAAKWARVAKYEY